MIPEAWVSVTGVCVHHLGGHVTHMHKAGAALPIYSLSRYMARVAELAGGWARK